MQHVCYKGTSIEVKLRKVLWAKGYCYRKNLAKLSIKPGIILTRKNIVLFCDREFFHGKDWKVLKTRIIQGNNPDY